MFLLLQGWDDMRWTIQMLLMEHYWRQCATYRALLQELSKILRKKTQKWRIFQVCFKKPLIFFDFLSLRQFMRANADFATYGGGPMSAVFILQQKRTGCISWKKGWGGIFSPTSTRFYKKRVCMKIRWSFVEYCHHLMCRSRSFRCSWPIHQKPAAPK